MTFDLVYFFSLLFVASTVLGCSDSSKSSRNQSSDKLLFEFSGKEDWQSHWMLDGERAQVINNDDGMELVAGPEGKNDTCHAVLWTKQRFSGDIRIEYDYTRTDTFSKYVNILYFHATGKGTSEFPTDISLWNDKRVVPSMRTYFNNMNTYHISYATSNPSNDYIRMRRYNPVVGGLQGTDIPDDHFKTGLFKPNNTYHIQVIKHGDITEMRIQNKSNATDSLVCRWDTSIFPPCDSGRIGLRHMYTRSARYKDFRVWSLAGN